MEIYSGWLVQKGFKKQEAEKIVAQVFGGASRMVETQSMTFEELLARVTSKKGTTLAGLKSMKQRQLKQVIQSGFAGAVKRSGELSKALRILAKK
jgi:pyrroline-5-carboxylate reductase